jgi:hypothetical protein
VCALSSTLIVTNINSNKSLSKISIDQKTINIATSFNQAPTSQTILHYLNTCGNIQATDLTTLDFSNDRINGISCSEPLNNTCTLTINDSVYFNSGNTITVNYTVADGKNDLSSLYTGEAVNTGDQGDANFNTAGIKPTPEQVKNYMKTLPVFSSLNFNQISINDDDIVAAPASPTNLGRLYNVTINPINQSNFYKNSGTFQVYTKYVLPTLSQVFTKQGITPDNPFH